jgi:hypothetical protein
MKGLGDLPGGSVASIPNAVSGDGSIVVGESSSGTPNGAFIWELGTGMRSLAEVLQNDFGLNLNGWVLWSAKGISSDGKTIVGSGKNPIGQTEAWIAYLDTKITTQCSDFAGKWSGSWSETNCDGINYSGTWAAEVYSDCSVIGTSITWITVTGTIDPSTGIFTGTGTSESCGAITFDGDFIDDFVSGVYSYSSGGGGSFTGSLQSTNDGGDGGGGGGGGG